MPYEIPTLGKLIADGEKILRMNSACKSCRLSVLSRR